MRILVIFTGGTIGSSENGGVISADAVSPRKKYKLIEAYRSANPDRADFVTVSPYTILSENLSANELNMLTKCVGEYLQNASDFDGIIITHGTDTLQYSAAMLGFSFGNSPLPIMLVSANYPIEDSRSNGLANFEASVEFIASGVGKGVFVAYRNPNSLKTDILRSTRLICHSEGSDKICDFSDSIYAEYSNGKIYVVDGNTPTNQSLGVIRLCENPPIAVVGSYPANSYSCCLDGVKAVILRPYHSSTHNTESDNFIRFCGEAKRRNIPIFAINAKKGAIYSSSLSLKKNGIISLFGSAFPATYMKLWIGLSTGQDIVRFMQTPICNEID